MNRSMYGEVICLTNYFAALKLSLQNDKVYYLRYSCGVYLNPAVRKIWREKQITMITAIHLVLIFWFLSGRSYNVRSVYDYFIN